MVKTEKKSKQITVTLATEVYEKLCDLADSRHMNPNWTARILLTEFLMTPGTN